MYRGEQMKDYYNDLKYKEFQDILEKEKEKEYILNLIKEINNKEVELFYLKKELLKLND